MKITYNKLVRDKIPDIINAQERTSCETRVLQDSEYLQMLNAKLQEELTEYLESGNVEELADLEEVLRAVLDAKGVSYEEFEKIRLDKCLERGAFKDKILLISTTQNDPGNHPRRNSLPHA